MFLFNRWYLDAYTARRALLGLAAVLLLAAGGVYLLTGEDPVAAVSAHAPADCRAYAIDVGTSTARDGDKQVRQKYLRYMHDELQRASRDRASVYLGFFAGQPPLELEPVRFDHADDNAFDADLEQSEKLVAAQDEVTSQLQQPTVATDGSAVMATVNYMAGDTPKGCDLNVITDGVENSELAAFGVGGHTPLLAVGAVTNLLDRLEGKDVIPDLSGRTLTMPFIGATAGRGPREEYGPLRRRRATAEFWVGFALRAHTQLRTRAT
jgi:hypothetical protein